jgi:hypothetical protein
MHASSPRRASLLESRACMVNHWSKHDEDRRVTSTLCVFANQKSV